MKTDYKIVAINQKVEENSLRVKLCCICRRSISRATFKGERYSVSTVNSFGQISNRYACRACSKKAIIHIVKNIKYMIKLNKRRLEWYKDFFKKPEKRKEKGGSYTTGLRPGKYD